MSLERRIGRRAAIMSGIPASIMGAFAVHQTAEAAIAPEDPIAPLSEFDEAYVQLTLEQTPPATPGTISRFAVLTIVDKYNSGRYKAAVRKHGPFSIPLHKTQELTADIPVELSEPLDSSEDV